MSQPSATPPSKVPGTRGPAGRSPWQRLEVTTVARSQRRIWLAFIAVAAGLSVIAVVALQTVVGRQLAHTWDEDFPRGTLPAGAGQDPTDPAADWPGRDRSRRLASERLPSPYEELKAIHTLMDKPGPHDWLAQHEELGQSFAAYQRANPVRPDKRLTTIYVQPLGPFAPKQAEVLKLAADYMAIYFTVPVKICDPIGLDQIPATAKRQKFGNEQLLSTWILDELLLARRPKDALAYIAFTASDLWPGEGWNFVFGQASLRDRVGVWSLQRYGDPAATADTFQLCLLRTIKTATHETGHILTMCHCVAYNCNMNGSNHLGESDSRPLALCPVCLAKLCWNVKAQPGQRFEKMIAFCHEHGLKEDEAFFTKSLAIVRAPAPPPAK